MSDWFPIRARTTKKFLKALRLNQATGPDGFSAVFLKTMAQAISVPLAMLIRRFSMRLPGHPNGRSTISFPYIRKAASTYQVNIEGFTSRAFCPRL